MMGRPLVSSQLLAGAAFFLMVSIGCVHARHMTAVSTPPSPPVPSQSSFDNQTHLGSWMTDMWPWIKAKPISQVWIPGSHDAGTFELGSKSHKDSCDQGWMAVVQKILGKDIDLIRSLAIAQVRSLDAQAREAGVRYFDLRLYPETDGKEYFVHCLLSKTQYDTHLQKLADYINRHPKSKEVYILHFYSFLGTWDTARHQKVINRVVSMFSGLIAKDVKTNMTLDSIVGPNGGPKVILVWNKKFTGMNNADSLVHQDYWIERPYDAVTTVDALLTRSAKYYSYYSWAITENERVFIMEGVLTADTINVLKLAQDILVWKSRVYSELIKWQRTVNWQLVQYMYKNWVGSTKPGMVLMMDDVKFTYGAAVVRANLPNPPAPKEFSFGTCSASYNYGKKECDYSNAKKCAPGYTDSNFWFGPTATCLCKCCLGNDCGCSTSPQASCK